MHFTVYKEFAAAEAAAMHFTSKRNAVFTHILISNEQSCKEMHFLIAISVQICIFYIEFHFPNATAATVKAFYIGSFTRNAIFT
jgi:hypothetical protein